MMYWILAFSVLAFGIGLTVYAYNLKPRPWERVKYFGLWRRYIESKEVPWPQYLMAVWRFFMHQSRER